MPITKEGLSQALQFFYRAIALDPDFSSAYGMATACYANRRAFGWITDMEKERADAIQMARAAVRLGQDDAVALSYAAFTLAFVVLDLQSAKAAVDQALALNLNLAPAWTYSGWINLWLGDSAVAVEHLSRAMQLNPRDITGYAMRNGMAHACFFLDRYDEAFAWATAMLREHPETHPALRIAAASAAFAGWDDVARQMGGRLQAVDPEFRVSGLKFLAKYAEGL